MDKIFARNVRVLKEEVYYGDVKAEKFSFYIKNPNNNYAYDLTGNKFGANDYIIKIDNKQKPFARLFCGTETKTAFYFLNTNLKPVYGFVAAPLIPKTLKRAYACVPEGEGAYACVRAVKLNYFKGKIPEDLTYSLETLRNVEKELNTFALPNSKNISKNINENEK